MEKIDFGNTYFSTKGMMPENGDNITLLWARKIVKNIANAYGIIGTVEFGGGREYRVVNLNLSQKYVYPPAVFLYLRRKDNGAIQTPNEYMPIFGEREKGAEFSITFIEWRPKIYSIINGDYLIIFCPVSNEYTHAYYRIVGV